MNSDDLAKVRCRALKNKIWQQLGYLNRLKRRMVVKRFPPSDPLLVLDCRAEDAKHQLHVDVHYRSCDGVGRG